MRVIETARLTFSKGDFMYKTYEVKFQYADSYSHWNWRNQQCTVSAKDEDEAVFKCIKMYGLGYDCQYKIISVEEVV